MQVKTNSPLIDLLLLLKPTGNSPNLYASFQPPRVRHGHLMALTSLSSELGDKSWHEIFEAIFSFVLLDKSNLYDPPKPKAKSKAKAKATPQPQPQPQSTAQPKGKAPEQRLEKCAAAVRLAALRSASKIGRKTVLAIVDHITQVLFGPDDEFIQPLLRDYVKALTEIVSRQAHAEVLARKDAGPWQVCVDFFLRVAYHILPSEEDTATLPHLARASPAPTASSLRSLPRANSSLQAQRHTGQGDGEPLKDALEGLYHLISAPNAPLLRLAAKDQSAKDITDLALGVLGTKHLNLGSTPTLCFSIINTVFRATEADDLDNAVALAEHTLPHMGYWWRAEKVSQDELIKALRNEISRSIFLMHLHLEHLAINLWDVNVREGVANLAEPLWQEYSKRSEAFRLKLTDLTFASSSSREHIMHLGLFGLRPHNAEGEAHWAVLQNLAFLEAMLLRPKKETTDADAQNGEQPRKRRRLHQDLNPLRVKLKSKHEGTVRTALQLVPFMLATSTVSHAEICELLGDLVSFVGDNDTTTASWALIACSR